MRKVKRWRYYCDFCKKSGGSKYHLQKHENSCTNNPNRVCGMCAVTGEDQPEIDDLKNIILPNLLYEECEFLEFDIVSFKPDTRKIVIKDLFECSSGCPACVLSALRQTNSICAAGVAFDWKKEKDAFWGDVNLESPEDMGF